MGLNFLYFSFFLCIFMGACQHRFTKTSQVQHSSQRSDQEGVIDLFEGLESQTPETLPGLRLVYEERVMNLANRTVLLSPQLTPFTLGRKIGAGTATVVYVVADKPQTVLRLSKSLGPLQLKLNQYIRNIKVLQKYQVPHAEVIGYESSRFVHVRRVGMHGISFEDVWVKPEDYFSQRNLPEPELLKNSFLRFVAQTSMFTEMSDFNWTQVLYDEAAKHWTLVDWDEEFVAEESGRKLVRLGAEQSVAAEIETDLRFALKQGEIAAVHAQGIDVFIEKMKSCVIAARQQLSRQDELDDEERAFEFKAESLPEACR